MNTDMKLKLLSGFLLIFLHFSQIASRSVYDCDTTFFLTHAGSEPQGSIATIGMDKIRRGRRSEVVKNVHTKGQKGTGGGSDIIRRPPQISHNGATTFQASPYLVMGVVMQVGVGLLLVLYFFF